MTCNKPRAAWLDRRRSVTGYLVQSLQPEEKPLVNAFARALTGSLGRLVASATLR